MHVPYQQQTVQDTGTSRERNTYFDNITVAPKKITHCQIIKNVLGLYLIKAYQWD